MIQNWKKAHKMHSTQLAALIAFVSLTACTAPLGKARTAGMQSRAARQDYEK